MVVTNVKGHAQGKRRITAVSGSIALKVNGLYLKNSSYFLLNLEKLTCCKFVNTDNRFYFIFQANEDAFDLKARLKSLSSAIHSNENQQEWNKEVESIEKVIHFFHV